MKIGDLKMMTMMMVTEFRCWWHLLNVGYRCQRKKIVDFDDQNRHQHISNIRHQQRYNRSWSKLKFGKSSPMLVTSYILKSAILFSSTCLTLSSIHNSITYFFSISSWNSIYKIQDSISWKHESSKIWTLTFGIDHIRSHDW